MTRNNHEREAGSALIMAVGSMVLLLGFSALTLTYVASSFRENRDTRDHVQRLYLAESALEIAVIQMNRGGDGALGSAGAPVVTEQGEYWVESTDNGDETFTLVSRARMNGKLRAIEAIVAERGHVFHHALFAGNSSGDPNYDLTFEGRGVQADAINGDVYTGNDMTVAQDAVVNGKMRSKGFVIGADGEEGVDQPVFDIASMNYETNHDVDVAAEFSAKGNWRWDDAGGSAWQLPEANPAHIFRKNPNNRNTENASTLKDDFYLEDPYEAVRTDPNQNGKDAYAITPGTPGNNKNLKLLYYIDGNLWIHNTRTFSMKFKGVGADGVRITIVVKGNVYVSDNLFYQNKNRDGLAIIAIKDDEVADSGNVYFGDSRFGTLEYMDAFLYAEEDFVDNNLAADGSKEVIVTGTMSAGDQVRILRTYNNDHHSRLEVNWDPRLKDGTLDLPGIPQASQNLSYEVVCWRIVSARP